MLGHLSAEEKRDGEPPRILFAVRDGRDVGYVVFKRKHKWPNARPAAEVTVGPMSGGPAARLALLRRVTDLDLAGLGQGPRRRPSPTPAVVGPGAARPRRRPPVRQPLGAPGGPAARRWPRAATRPSATSSSRWPTSRLPGTPGAGGSGSRTAPADVTRTDDDAEVSLPVAALGAAYLGGANLAAQARAGVVAEHRPGAARELWRAFRTDLGPYAARGF